MLKLNNEFVSKKRRGNYLAYLAYLLYRSYKQQVGKLIEGYGKFDRVQLRLTREPSRLFLINPD